MKLPNAEDAFIDERKFWEYCLKKMDFKLFDVVFLNEDLPQAGLRQGNIGTIIEVLDEKTFIVEFVDRKGAVYAETVLKSAQLLKVLYEPVGA